MNFTGRIGNADRATLQQKTLRLTAQFPPSGVSNRFGGCGTARSCVAKMLDMTSVLSTLFGFSYLPRASLAGIGT